MLFHQFYGKAYNFVIYYEWGKASVVSCLVIYKIYENSFSSNETQFQRICFRRELYDCYDIGVAVEVQEGWKRRLCLNY